MDSLNVKELDLTSHNNNLFEEDYQVSFANLELASSKEQVRDDESVNTAVLVGNVEQLVKRVNKPTVAPEDEFVTPGRKKYDRDSLTGFDEELVKPISKIIHNSEICRQNYALREFAYTLQNTIKMDDVGSKDTPVNLLKPAISDAFYV